eukprot:CAMPEP_0119004702 /NCGR_PEP_ID=MMETSP1176-20130426/1301_1 /TAXON_ID=265551 /ORGANISM="Synedropsis recta cf, Strain CCMP1620" /LENGTH=825 /DNA_ID=CAMNT_0006956437 /DNA_START=12 /DNA_END=2489 /DNA_ORIENTATION=+
MNGGYGGAAFDFSDSFGYGASGDPQDQHNTQPQQRFGLPNAAAPHFDQYDPTGTMAAANPLLHQLQYNNTYNSTSATHHTFLPPPGAAATAAATGTYDASSSLQMSNTAQLLQQQQQQQQQLRQQRLQHAQQSYPGQASSIAGAYSAPPLPLPAAYGIPSLDQIQSISPQKLMSAPAETFLFPDPSTTSIAKQADQARKENPDQWLEGMQIKCSDVSLEPLSGTEVLKRVRSQTDNVVTRYLPCVEFLVACQQDLRAGLAAATQKRLVRHSYRDSMTPRQFYQRYMDPLPDRFYGRNKTLMENTVLKAAVKEITKLCADAKRVEYQGCEVMKNTFLGGMKDGESWGLRKWLSKHGGALHICNDLECILRSCQDLDRSTETTRRLSERLRPLAKQAQERLKNDVPASYQEVSTAHPYLPFFHRLESALKGMGQFDPDDDDVICIDDDDEVEEMKQLPKKKAPAPKRKAANSIPAMNLAKKRKTSAAAFMENQLRLADLKPAARGGAYDDDEDSIIEILEVKPPPKMGTNHSAAASNNTCDFSVDIQVGGADDWECPRCTMLNAPDTRRCCMCDKTIDGRDGGPESDDDNPLQGFGDFPFDDAPWEATGKPAAGGSVSPLLAQMGGGGGEPLDIRQMLDGLEKIALAADSHQHRALRPSDVACEETFWDIGAQYASALRLLISTLRNRDARIFVEPVDDQDYLIIGRPAFSGIIKHPTCLRDIATALVSPHSGCPLGSGRLPNKSLSSWNMWRGMDLLQALDLVMLNNLAYNGKEKTKERSMVNRLRRVMWEGINTIITSHVGSDIEKRRQYTPTRRGETSGFVVRK